MKKLYTLEHSFHATYILRSENYRKNTEEKNSKFVTLSQKI